jgi:hypothetical protein
MVCFFIKYILIKQGGRNRSGQDTLRVNHKAVVVAVIFFSFFFYRDRASNFQARPLVSVTSIAGHFNTLSDEL